MPTSIMPIEHIADWEKRLARQDAFWDREIIDRPVACITYPRPNPDYPPPAARAYGSLRERWFDGDHLARRALHGVMNTAYEGDALPMYFPNLGPEIFSAFFGSPLEFGETTSWSEPIVKDWQDADKLQFSTDNTYWRQIESMTDAALEIGRNRFYTGMTDLHPGGDALAAFRDPMQFNIDLIESPEEVKRLLDRVTEVYLKVLNYSFDKLQKAGQAFTAWPGIVSSRRWYVPSNDFSCMVSPAMFDEFFMPAIVEECKALEASLYHLDGPDALRHLDRLLSIPELNAIQWVYGAGRGRASDWLPVYRRCQAAGKGLQINLNIDELEFFIDNLEPEGLWLSIAGVENHAMAEAVLKRLNAWK